MDAMPSQLVLPRSTTEDICKGLIVHSRFVDLITSGQKSIEIRNQYLRCIPEGGEFYILRAFEKGTGKNVHGQCCVEVAAKVIFKSNQFIAHDDFDSFFANHQVPSGDYEAMRKGWKQDKGGCVGWHIELKEVLAAPRYLPSGSQDCFAQCPRGFVYQTFFGQL